VYKTEVSHPKVLYVAYIKYFRSYDETSRTVKIFLSAEDVIKFIGSAVRAARENKMVLSMLKIITNK
jgi:hypothetical protein